MRYWAGKTPTVDQWRDILEKHARWLRSEKGGERADLRFADLSSADLSSADLRFADLSSADLSSADLSSADLSFADLSSADLRSANLRFADLSFADLSSADLSFADLRSADLRSANLRFADLSFADLSSADLRFADLRSANEAELVIARTRIVGEGALIVWKQCRDKVIVRMQIPAEAKRSHAFGRKCRAEYAKVLEVIGATKGISLHDGKTEYVKGKIVRCDAWDENWQNECGGGIHFYLSKVEAEAHS